MNDLITCPFCGEKINDINESCYGEDLEFDSIDFECGYCGEHFYLSRSVVFYYDVRKKDICEKCPAWAVDRCVLDYRVIEIRKHHECKNRCNAPVNERDLKYKLDIKKDLGRLAKREGELNEQ